MPLNPKPQTFPMTPRWKSVPVVLQTPEGSWPKNSAIKESSLVDQSLDRSTPSARLMPRPTHRGAYR